MRRDDYFLMIASGILKLSDADRNQALNHFAQTHELYELGKPGFISLGAIGRDGKEVAFDRWITDLTKDNARDITCSWAATNNAGNLAPHIAAAFAGSQLLVLRIVSNSIERHYLLRTFFSPQHELKPSDFLTLIDAQKIKTILWTRISEIVLNHNKLNNRPEFDAKDIKSYLVNDGKSEFDFLSSQLIQEVQIECTVSEEKFIIPDDLKQLFFKSDFLQEEPTRKSVFLYPLKEVSVDEMKELIAAQSFGEEVWDQFIKDQEQYGLSDLPNYSAKEWPAKLTTLTSEQRSTVFNFLCRAICSLCESKDIDRVIPDNLKDSFGPDELEHKRAQARGSSDVWYLESNKNPWESYVFEEVVGLSIEPQVSIGEARKRFVAALESIAAFANKISSPFEEAFRLGLFFLREENTHGNFDETHVSQLTTKLTQDGFSEQALQHFNSVISYSFDMNALKFSNRKISDLLAVSISDVFGGMGSWNDQYFEDDKEMYDRVSAELFQALKIFFSSALSD